MEGTVTVSTLFQRYGQRLGLHWVTGQAGSARAVGHSEATPGTSLIGHLNIIHPNRLQILGQLELDHLDSLSPALRQDAIQQLCDAQPAGIILAEQLEPPADLLRACEQQQIPLLGSSLRSAKLINCLDHYLGGELAEKAVVHGVFLEVHGMGVLLTGESGVGKSELALELLTRGHRLIADDAPEFSRVGPDIVRGRCPEALRDFLEVRGLGVLNVRAMYGDSAIKLSKDLRLVIHLQRLASHDLLQLDRLRGIHRTHTILEIEMPEVTLPVAPGRNLAVLVEAAVRNYILLRKGYNAPEAFIQRQREMIQQQTATAPASDPPTASSPDQ
ncbi:MAG: HPr(Ser) kinase/phosphatase [Gammaproteobacteria bacterium]|nr:HPr(Ser) kinase/phosphatase [Gammaproteobacteria bacterium]